LLDVAITGALINVQAQEESPPEEVLE